MKLSHLSLPRLLSNLFNKQPLRTQFCAKRCIGNDSRFHKRDVKNEHNEYVYISSKRMSELISSEITNMALKPMRSLDRRTLATHKDPVKLAELLLTELPIRYAQRIKLLDDLISISNGKDFSSIHKIYMRSYGELRSFVDNKIPLKNHIHDFRVLLVNIINRHRKTIALIQGFKRLGKERAPQPNNLIARLAFAKNEPYSTKFTLGAEEHWAGVMLDTFLSSRIVTTAAIKYFLLLSNPDKPCPSRFSADPFKCAKIAWDTICTMASQKSPNANLPTFVLKGKKGAIVPFMPQHLCFILQELLQNAFRSMLTNNKHTSTNPGKIEILITHTEEFCVIRISDTAGGINSKILPHIWSYMTGTSQYGGCAQPEEIEMDDRYSLIGQPAVSILDKYLIASDRSEVTNSVLDCSKLDQALAGAGCGLPIVRLYAHYLSGKIRIASIPNQGTSVYLEFSLLEQQRENQCTSLFQLSRNKVE